MRNNQPDLVRMSRENKNLQASLDYNLQENQSLRTKLKYVSQENDDLKKENANLRNTVNYLSKEFDATIGAQNRLIGQQYSLIEKIADTEKQIAMLQEQIADREKQIAMLQKRTAKLQRELQKPRSQEHEMTATVTTKFMSDLLGSPSSHVLSSGVDPDAIHMKKLQSDLEALLNN